MNDDEIKSTYARALAAAAMIATTNDPILVALGDVIGESVSHLYLTAHPDDTESTMMENIIRQRDTLIEQLKAAGATFEEPARIHLIN